MRLPITQDADMKSKKNYLLIVFLSLIASCAQSDPSTEMYICLHPKVSAHFTNDLASILRRDGFNSTLGRAIDENGHTTFVLQANRRFVKVWAQNVPANPPYEVSDLDKFAMSPSVIPTEYFVSVQSRSLLSRSAAREDFKKIRAQLLSAGFKEIRKVDKCPSD
jgi:hypothetical protein